MIKKIGLLLIIGSIFLCMATVSATDNNTLSDDIYDTAKCEITDCDFNDTVLTKPDTTGSFYDLNKELNNRDYIFLNQDYKYEGSNDAEPRIEKDYFYLNGQGHVIDGSNMARGLFIMGKNVMIENVIFKNCNSELGSAINAIEHNLTLNNCTFINCISYQGTVQMECGHVTDCTFIENTAHVGSCVVSSCNEWDHQTTFEYCHFYNNTGDSRINYYVVTHPLTIFYQCVFEGNSIKPILSYDKDVRIIDCEGLPE